MTIPFDREGLNQLLYQTRETMLRAITVYDAALACATRDELGDEWRAHRDAARRRAQLLGTAFDALGLDADTTSRGRTAAAALGKSLLEVIAYAAQGDDRAAAERVAAECVLLVETKDQLNRTLLAIAAERITGPVAQVLKDMVEAIEADGEPRVLHTRGWARELWLDALGLAAVLPPPEEVTPGLAQDDAGERRGLAH
ncbi:hypothetical protein [Burkholderia plantarii]|uniref:hypothetical protein n=1 Tax=Burkholderia plantarii TaxID=41899 RepID=UPI0018DDDA85|nr:hypothetical protein [Burkholderia plantarii]MBI0325599.1 hypothetical protein [Burkholderia plantarii]